MGAQEGKTGKKERKLKGYGSNPESLNLDDETSCKP